MVKKKKTWFPDVDVRLNQSIDSKSRPTYNFMELWGDARVATYYLATSKFRGELPRPSSLGFL